MNNDLQLDSLIKQMAEGHHSELPAPGLVWWRAQILRRQRQQERIERPMKIMRLIALFVSLVVFAAGISSYWSEFQEIFSHQSRLFLPLGIMAFTVAVVSLSMLRSIAKQR